MLVCWWGVGWGSVCPATSCESGAAVTWTIMGVLQRSGRAACGPVPSADWPVADDPLLMCVPCSPCESAWTASP